MNKICKYEIAQFQIQWSHSKFKECNFPQITFRITALLKIGLHSHSYRTALSAMAIVNCGEISFSLLVDNGESFGW